MRDEEHLGAPHGDDQSARAEGAGSASGLADQRRPGIEPVLEQLDCAIREFFGVDRARGRDDALDVLGELRLGPDDAIDAEQRRALPDRRPRRKSSRETKQIVCGEPSWLAMPQATILTSSRPVQAMKTSARSVPAALSTSADVPPPTRNWTSSFSNRSAAAAVTGR